MQLDDVIVISPKQGVTTLKELQVLAQDTIRVYQALGLAEGLSDGEYIQVSQAHVILTLIDALVGDSEQKA